jgi:hypothetical protein
MFQWNDDPTIVAHGKQSQDHDPFTVSDTLTNGNRLKKSSDTPLPLDAGTLDDLHDRNT